MKKILLTFVGLLTWTLAVHAADPQLISVSWDINGDSTTTCPEYANQQALCNGDTLWKDSIGYFYKGNKSLSLATGKDLGYGPYWNVSKTTQSNAICLIVPGRCEATIAINNRIGDKNQYTFYLFALALNEDIPSNLLNQTDKALDSKTWKMSTYTEGTTTLTANLATYTDDLYKLVIIFNNANTDPKGMRHRGITYTQTKVYPKPEEAKLDTIIVTDPQTLTFAVGDTYEFGGKVTAYYGDSTVDVTSSAVFTNTSFTKAGQQDITVSYTDGVTKSTSYEVTVNAIDPLALNSATWTVYNGTTTGISYWYQQRIGALDTLTKNNVQYFYLQGKRTYEANKNGAYWHNSSTGKGDNVLAITARGGVKSNIELTVLPTASKTYKFYVFAQDYYKAKFDSLYSITSTALDSAELVAGATVTSTPVNLQVDLTKAKTDQTIYIIYTGTTGLRHRGITYTETAMKTQPITSAYWDMIGDSTALCPEYQNQVKLAAFDTLTSDMGVKLFYLSSLENDSLKPQAKNGVYWNRSNSHTRAMVLTAPGGQSADVTLRLRPGKTNAPYVVYVFAQNAGKAMPKFHKNLSDALTYKEWTNSKYAGKNVTISVDLRDKVGMQDIYFLLVDENNNDGARICSVKYQQTTGTKLDFIGDSTEYCQAYEDELTFIAKKAITRNGITYKYNRGLGLSKDEGKDRGNGAYWKRSNDSDGDKALILTVPGNSLGTIKLGLRPGSDTATYNFYVFAKPASESYTANKLYQHLDEAIYSTTWSFNAYTEDILSLPVDLTQKNEAQKLYVIFTHNSKHNRLRWIDYSYISTLVYSVTESENGLAGVDNKLKVPVQLTRSTFIAASYNTICLPFSLTKAQMTDLFGEDYSLLQYIGSDMYQEQLDLKFEKATAIEEGVPYLIKPKADVTFSAQDMMVTTKGSEEAQSIVDPQTRANFNGTYTGIAMTANDKSTWFLGANNVIHYPSESANMAGLRAYFEMVSQLPVGVSARMMIMQPTGMEEVSQAVESNAATKVLKDGQIIILRDGKQYNAQGAQLK